jgi:hypothetical protein
VVSSLPAPGEVSGLPAPGVACGLSGDGVTATAGLVGLLSAYAAAIDTPPLMTAVVTMTTTAMTRMGLR